MDHVDGIEEHVAAERKVIEKAWRAAIIGIILLPPLLNLYSCALIFRHGLFRLDQTDWRVSAALAVNIVVILTAVVLGIYGGIYLDLDPLVRPAA